MEILVFRHVDCEPPAAYAPPLKKFANLVTVRLGVDPLPNHYEFGAVLSMGGPMGVNDRIRIGWIADEINYLRGALEHNVPIWGVCLGAQMLAAAIGAEVTTGQTPEVGVGTVTLTSSGKEDEVWGDLGSHFKVLQWHSDTFELPDGAELLASSAAYPNQLFRYGNSYGIQFHLEASFELARQWLELDEYRTSLTQALGADREDAFLDSLRRDETDILCNAEGVINRWLSKYVLTAAK